MTILSTNSLGARLQAIYLLIVLLVLLVLFTAVGALYFFTQRAELIERLNYLADLNIFGVEAAVWEYDTDHIDALMKDIGEVPYVQSVVVSDESGRVLSQIGAVDTAPESADFVASRVLRASMSGSDEVLGNLTITVHAGEIRANTKQLLWFGLVVLLVLGATLMLVTRLATRRLIGEPLERLRGAIERMKTDNVREQVDWQSEDELGEVVDAYNEMQTRQAQTESELASRQAELERAHEELEIRVEQRTAELQESQQLLEGVLSTVRHGVGAFDEDGRMVAWNNNYQSYIDIPESMMTRGQPLRELVTYLAGRGTYGVTDVESFIEQRIAELMSGRPTRRELIVDGKRIFDAISEPMVDGGFVITYTDITARKAMENELREAKELAEAATETKASFLATMSHEIRTPLNGVIGMVDLLAQSQLDDDQRQLIRTVRDSGYSLLTIINDILDFSKIEAGKLDIETISMSLEDVVEGTALTLAPTAGRKQVEIITYIPSSLSIPVLGDPVRVRQVLFNLCGNAVKFSDQGGRVIIQAEPVLDEDGQIARVCFRVIDEGVGISEEGRQRLFRPFSQVETSTTRRYGGTGLGLSICQRLTEMMNGEIAVDSELGRGSEFRVTLPFRAAESSRVSEQQRDLSGLTIMVVSPLSVQRELWRDALEHWGARVIAEASADAVLELLDSDRSERPAVDVIALVDASQTESNVATRRRFLDAGALPYPRFVIAEHPARPHGALVRLPEVTRVESNPVTRRALVSAVAVAAGRASPEVRADEPVAGIARVAPPTVEAAFEHGQLILVAEDNVTNQDVIRRQLNMLGYQCEIAADGREALQMWRRGRYAVLLTDCHMPEMDGFELTAAIRESERDEDRRAPIIAITASALQGEAERCLAAGMDDFLAKPVEMTTLEQAIAKWMGPPKSIARSGQRTRSNGTSNADAPDQASSSNGAPAIDERALKDTFGDDPETFKEILSEFLEAARANVHEIEQGAEQQGAQDVRSAAHKLKSSARTVGANALADLCFELERAGDANDWQTIEGGLRRLPTIMRGVASYIESL